MKIILAFLLMLVSSSLTAGKFASYAIMMMEDAQSRGEQKVILEIPSKYVSEALEVGIISVKEGSYIECFTKNGTEYLYINWSKGHKNKQLAISKAAGEYASKFINGYNSCDEDYWVIGLHSDNYAGNFYWGCGKSFINMMDQLPVAYKKWDYINMLVSTTIHLMDRGYDIDKTKSVKGIHFFNVVKKKKSKKKGKLNGKKSKL